MSLSLERSTTNGPLPFQVHQPKDPFDAAFISLCDAEAVYTRETPTARQKLLDSLGYQLIDVRRLLGAGAASVDGHSMDMTQKLVSNMQISLQYLIHRLGCYKMELKETKKERDELFDEVVFLRDAAALSQRKVKQLQHNNQQKQSIEPQREYKCRICGNIYPIQYALTSHMLKRHSGVDATNNNATQVGNHSAEWHTTAMTHQRGAALAAGTDTTTGSPAPKLPSLPGGSGPMGSAAPHGQHDPLMDALDSRLEVSQITELRSEITHLKRSLESVTVDLRVSQEIQRDREVHFNQAQEQLRSSLSPQGGGASQSPPHPGGDVMSSVETVVLLRNQTNRLEAIERAMIRQSSEEQHHHNWLLANQSQVPSASPSAPSPFSIPNFSNVAGGMTTSAKKPQATSGSIDGGNAPSSGRSTGRQAHFAEPAAAPVVPPASTEQASGIVSKLKASPSADDMVVLTASTSAAASPSSFSGKTGGVEKASTPPQEEAAPAPLATWRPGPAKNTGTKKSPPIMSSIGRPVGTPPSESGSETERKAATPVVTHTTTHPRVATPATPTVETTPIKQVGTTTPATTPPATATPPAVSTPVSTPAPEVSTPVQPGTPPQVAPLLLIPPVGVTAQPTPVVAPTVAATQPPDSARSTGVSSTSSSGTSSSGSYTTNTTSRTGSTLASAPVSARAEPPVDDIAALQVKYAQKARQNAQVMIGGGAPITGASVVPVTSVVAPVNTMVAPVTPVVAPVVPLATSTPSSNEAAPIVPIKSVVGGGAGLGGGVLGGGARKKKPMSALVGGAGAGVGSPTIASGPAPREHDDEDDDI